MYKWTHKVCTHGVQVSIVLEKIDPKCLDRVATQEWKLLYD